MKTVGKVSTNLFNQLEQKFNNTIKKIEEAQAIIKRRNGLMQIGISMPELLEAVNDFYHNHGRYPIVYVSPDFYDKNADSLIKSGIAVGIEIEDSVDEWELK